MSRQESPAAALDGSGLRLVRPAACPTCGSADLLPLTEAVALPGLDMKLLQTGVEDGSMHLHRSGSGEWWVCRQAMGAD
jgi:hypothetical protein